MGAQLYQNIVRVPCFGFDILFGCRETFMENNHALSLVPTEGQAQDVFLRNAFMGQFRQASEAEPFIVVRISNKNAPLGSQSFQA